MFFLFKRILLYELVLAEIHHTTIRIQYEILVTQKRTGKTYFNQWE